MKLSILIPTYNRSKYLLKNLELLNEYFHRANYFQNIEIVVSNNNSPDNTHDIITDFQKENSNLQLRYFSQKENIGLEKNALFVLKEALGEYVMYLGDDDYIEFQYLFEAFEHLTNNSGTHVIIPNFVPIDIEGTQIGAGRDDKFPNRLHKAGFNNCLSNSWRGHQLSGLILKRENLYICYFEQNVGNIYPFIFFVAHSCLHGNTYHLTQYPVKVTQPGQNNKDWNYGKDGLINEIFDNYKKLPINYIQKTLLQLQLIHKQPIRLWMYKVDGISTFMKAFIEIWKSKNSTFLFKAFFPSEVFLLYMNMKAESLISRKWR